MTRTAPYTHFDSSSCWTKNCSRGHALMRESSHLIADRQQQIKAVLGNVSKSKLIPESKHLDFSTWQILGDMLNSQATEEERKAAIAYVNLEYSYLRKYLVGFSESGRPFTEPLSHKLELAQKQVTLLDSLISKAPSFAEPITVFRGSTVKPFDETKSTLLDQVAMLYPVGGIVTDKSYVSTSIDDHTPLAFARKSDDNDGNNHYGFMMMIETKQGACMSGVIGWGDIEKEVLLPRGKHYEVVKVANRKYQGIIANKPKTYPTVYLRLAD